ncbi:hypothetical protein IMZ48_12905 [Candidatus Bathyarchaeota archaeon]|nr:hypothetical protein [Candidatus Bathyarchaeota archaeon]
MGHTISPWDLHLDGSSRYDEHRAAPADGLGDRERSLSPDTNGWDTLLTTLAPDPQPPSAGSSFASATASTAATSQSTVPSAPPTQRHPRTRESAGHHECGFCDRCLRRRANLASLRSRGPPPSSLPTYNPSSTLSPRANRLPPIGDAVPQAPLGRRALRNRHAEAEYSRRHSDLQRVREAARRRAQDYLSPTAPDEDTGPGLVEVSIDGRRRALRRRE